PTLTPARPLLAGNLQTSRKIRHSQHDDGKQQNAGTRIRTVTRIRIKWKNGELSIGQTERGYGFQLRADYSWKR
ncbi:hypothetical protein PENTCL1PPCAC_304, partial [Pristionchus entomophagus]